MRWERKFKRVIKQFAILPINIGIEWRWLETVYILQIRSPHSGFWYSDSFVTKEVYDRLKNERRK